MLRKVACAVTFLAFGLGIAMADEFRGVIKKVDGKTVTVAKVTGGGKGKKPEIGADMTLTAADNVKVVKGKFNFKEKKLELGDAVEGGLGNKMFTSISEKGVFATITTEGDKITQIVVSQFGGKKKKKDQ